MSHERLFDAGVALQINGAAEVKWSETTGAGKNRRTIHYSGRQDYMHSTTYLAGSREGNSIELLPGIHTYRFSCMLPPNLVTSVEAKHGHVRYTVKVVLERSWKIDQSYKVAFTVLRHVDLNLENYEVRLPMQMDKAKTFCCGPCKSAPMYISAQVPISGYVPGQTVVVKIEVNNESNKTMEEISTKLLQVVSFISQRPYTKIREIPTILAEVRCAGIGKHSKASYEQQLQIPPMPPSSRSCQVLTINYYVEVEGKVPGPVINPKVRIPITMGTIPLSLDGRPTFESPINVAPIVEQPTTSAEPSATPFPPELRKSLDRMMSHLKGNDSNISQLHRLTRRSSTPLGPISRMRAKPTRLDGGTTRHGIWSISSVMFRRRLHRR